MDSRWTYPRLDVSESGITDQGTGLTCGLWRVVVIVNEVPHLNTFFGLRKLALFFFRANCNSEIFKLFVLLSYYPYLLATRYQRDSANKRWVPTSAYN